MAEVEVDDVDIETPEPLDVRSSIGLVPCPSCQRRDRRSIARAAIVPAVAGLVVALVGSFVFAFVGMMTLAGPDVKENEAQFPRIIYGAVALALVAGGLFAWRLLARVFRRAALAVHFGAEGALGDEVPVAHFAAPEAPREKVALGVAAFGALVLGVGVGAPSGMTVLAVGLAIGCVAGLIRGATMRERVVFVLPFWAGVLGVAFATRLYVEGRSSIVNIELFIPLLLGAVPGAILYVVVSQLISNRAR